MEKGAFKLLVSQYGGFFFLDASVENHI